MADHPIPNEQWAQVFEKFGGRESLLQSVISGHTEAF